MNGAGRMFRLHCSPDLPEPPGAACLQRLEAVARRTLSCHSAGGSVEAILTDDDEVRRLNELGEDGSARSLGGQKVNRAKRFRGVAGSKVCYMADTLRNKRDNC